MVKTTKLVIILPKVSAAGFMLRNWKKTDYKKSVPIFIEDCKVDIKFIKDDYSSNNERFWPMYSEYTLTFDHPSEEIVKGLHNPNSEEGEKVAKYIYEIYQEATKKLVFYGRYKLNLPSVLDGMLSKFDELFYEDNFLNEKKVIYKIGSKVPVVFQLEKKKSRGKLHPVFQAKNLLTPEKWIKLAEYSNKKPKNTEEVEELVKIRAKAAWGEKRIPVVETMAVLEVVIRNKVHSTLLNKGLSKKKIKETETDIGMALLLNTFLPLILNKKEMDSLRDTILSVNTLRKIRNDIMHNNLKDVDIEQKIVVQGIDSAIRLTQALS